MITAIKAENIDAYKALFEEASDILSGYKRVRTYDSEVAAYYYKDAKAETAKELFKVDPSITDLASFAKSLAKYSILYVKEGEAAEGFEPMLGITTLEEYFSWLRNLGNIDRKYTVLPLDEDHFEINADTRAITIPASFKKNGVAVLGDDLAEVLYFRVDRYFDYMDLNNCDIYIQWETPKDPATGLTTKSLSPAYIRDIDSEPGKLIFGWALSDAITANSGTLKFSVRFFQWADDEKAATGAEKIIAYSFSTLTASVSIQAGLNFNLESDEHKVDDVGNRLIERLENSEIAGGYAAATPIFEKNLDKPNTDLIYDLDPTTHTFDLLVQAYATDTGAITYSWKKQGLNPDNSEEDQDIETYSGTNVFVKVDDLTKLNKAYAYYWTNGNDEKGNPIYTRYDRFTINADGTITPDAEDLNKKDSNGNKTFALYVKQSRFTADSAGLYWCVAENRITNSSSAALSKKAKFPRPEDVKISQQPTPKAILTELSDGTFECRLIVVVDNTDGDLTYQWQKDDNYALNYGSEQPAFENVPEVEGNTGKDAEYIVTTPGRYRVVVTNTRNYSDAKPEYEEWAKKTLTSEVSRVTKFPSVPLIKDADLNTKLFQVSALTDENCPTIEMSPDVESDGYTVSWYLNENNEDYLIAENINLGEDADGNIILKASFNPASTLYADKIINLSEDGDLDGAYYAIVTNWVNGESNSTDKPAFEDMFKVNK